MRRSLASAVALLAAACGRAEPGFAPAYVRVLDRAAEGTAPARERPPALIAVERTALRDGETLLRAVALEGSGALLFEAEILLEAGDGDGDGPGADAAGDGGPVATLVLAALAELPRGGALEDALPLVRQVLVERFVRRGDGGAFRQVVVPPEGARAVALQVALHGGGDGARALLGGARVGRADDLALLEAASLSLDLEAEPGRPVTGRFAMGGVSRPALALEGGGPVLVPVDVPAGGGTLVLELGLCPIGAVADGAPVEIDVDLERGGARTPLVRWRGAARDPKRARWARADAVLAPPGGPAVLAFRARGAAAGGVVALAGAPRIAPAGGPGPKRRPRGAPPNVVLISLDTLRADRVGFLGCEADTTPALDALARESVVLARTWSTSSYTLPAHVSILGGQLPEIHGVHDPARRVSRRRTRLLAEILAARGYATAAFTGGGYVDPRFGFARGFDRYGYVDPAANLESQRVRAWLAGASELDLDLARAEDLDAAIAWMGEHAHAPFLLFLHTYAAHELDPEARHLAALGLDPPDPERDDAARAYLSYGRAIPDTAEARAALARLRELYDGAVRQADEAVGRITAALRALDLLEDTVLVVVSDHGKEIGERGYVGHGHSLFEELVRVPFLIRAPGLRPARVEEPATLVDVLPTVLALLDVPPPRDLDGRDLFGPARADPRPIYAEVDALVVRRALVEHGLKTIVAPAEAPSVLPPEPPVRTYDLRRDPLEREPRLDDPEGARRVESFHAALLRRAAALGPRPPKEGLDESLVERLRALGYVDAAGDGPRAGGRAAGSEPGEAPLPERD